MAGLLQNIKLFGEYIPWFQSLREKGLAAFEKQGVPTAKTEAWKYTKPRDLNADDFVIEPSNFLDELRAETEDACGCHHEDCGCGEEGECHCHHEDGECHGGGHCREHELNLDYGVPFDAYQIHFVNGKFIPVFPALPRGVEVITLMEAVLIEEAKEHLGRLVNLDEHPFAALNTHYMEEAAEADYVVIIDDGKISAEGTPLELKNIYTGDYITIYDVDEKDIKALDVEYEQIRNGYRLSVPNTKAATELIIRNPQLFNDYEITKGKMDDVFLAVTGKTLVGGAEK